MSEKNSAQDVKSGVSPAVAEDVAKIAAEVQSVADAAQRGWKVSAVVFAILLAIIAGYMKFLVYDRFVEMGTDPAVLTQTVLDMIDSQLEAQRVPSLESGKLPEWGAKQLKEIAPSFMSGTVKPQLEAQLKDLPNYRKQLIDKAKDLGPQKVNEAIGLLENELLPKARAYTVDEVSNRVDALLDQGDKQLTDFIVQVVKEQKDSVQMLTDPNVVNEAVHGVLEQQLGSYIDEAFSSVEPHLVSASNTMQKLIHDTARDDKERLEFRILQLVYTLYERAAQAAPRTESKPENMLIPASGIDAGAIKDVVKETVDEVSEKIAPKK